MNSSFQCWFCEENLENCRYVIHENFALCFQCFDKNYAHKCVECKQCIGIETSGIIFQDQTWHRYCFICSICQQTLVDQQFAYENEKFFCRICFIQQFARTCHRCNRSIEPGEKIIEYKTNIYHQACFHCQSCEQKLINSEFYEHDQYILCMSCYLRLLVVYCIKCHQAIENDGLIYHNHPFHFSCFICTICKQSIGNQRYVEIDSQAYCLNCSKKI